MQELAVSNGGLYDIDAIRVALAGVNIEGGLESITNENLPRKLMSITKPNSL